MSPRQIAIIHDYLVDSGGAERVVEALPEQFSEAAIYSSVSDSRTTFPSFRSMDLRLSFLRRLPITKRNYKFLLPFFSFAFEQFDQSEYDVI